MCDSPRMGCAWWTTPTWCQQAEIRWARRGIFIVSWCDSGKLCVLAALPFQSQKSDAFTRMWRWCQVQKERAIGAVHWKDEGCCCNLSVGVALKVWFSHCPIHENDQRWTCTRIYTLRHFNILIDLEVIIFVQTELVWNWWFSFELLRNFRFSFGTAGYCRTAG